MITGFRYLTKRAETYGDEPLVEFFILSLILIFNALAIRKITVYELQNLKRAKLNEFKYRTIFENIQDVYYEHTPDGEIIEISPSVEKSSKYVKEDIIGKNIAGFFADSAEKDKVLHTIFNEGKINNFEIRLLNKDNSIIHCLVNATLLKDEQGEVQKIVGSIRDITGIKKLEEEFQQVQKMEAVGRLAGGVAHDFNNLLTVITGYSDLVRVDPGANDTIKDHAEQIQIATERAEALTCQLLAFSRRQFVKPKVLNINQVINNSFKIFSVSSVTVPPAAFKIFSRLIGEDNQITMKLTENLPTILADPNQIGQILINLLVNARDAIDECREKESPKEISIETDYVYLDREFVATHLGSKEEPRIMFSVSDNGVGMDHETLNRIFEPFFTTKVQGKGTGLGLSTVYGIVKQNQANIYVYSEPGTGTTFKIYWPLYGSEAEKITQKEDEKEPKPGSETILLVEDDQSVRDFASKALKSLNYIVLTAENGEEAIKIVLEGKVKPDLLFTDMVMPGINGRELSEKIRMNFPTIPVIFTSGYTDDKIVRNGFLQNDVDFIPKPYSRHTLSSKVREVLERQIQDRQLAG